MTTADRPEFISEEESALRGHHPFLIFTLILQALTIVLLAVLNLLGLLVLRRASRAQETNYTYLASLTVSDLFVGILNGTMNLTQTAAHGWVLGDFACAYLSGIAAPTFYMMSICSLLLLTVDRFIAIVCPLRYRSLMTLQRSRVIVTSAWITFCVVNVILFGICSTSAISEQTGLCEYDVPHIFEYVTAFTVTVTLPLILVLYLYILRVARHHARRIAAHNQIGNVQEGRSPQQPISTKSATTVFIITTTLCLCWMPGLVLHLLRLIGVQPGSGITTIVYTIFLSNGWLNVVIYYWRNRELRQVFHNLLHSSCG